MFNDSCPNCFFKSSSIGRFRCFRCENEEVINTGMSNNDQAAIPEVVDTGHIEVASGSRNRLAAIATQTVGTGPVKSMKRNEPYDKKLTENTQEHKQCKKEIYEEVGSPYCTQGSINRKAAQESSEASSEIVSKKKSDDISNQMTYEYNYLDNENSLFHTMKESTTCNRRIITHDSPSKEVYSTFGQATASNSGILEITQKDYRTNRISDSIGTENESASCGDNIVPFPGPSGAHINENEEYVSVEIAPKNLKKQEALVCGICKEEITKHKSAHKGNNSYECCVCTYNTCKHVELLMHSNDHYPKLFCNKCEIYHKEGDSHDTVQLCLLCEKHFQCRTKLKEHCKEHKNYFKTNCRLCCGIIDDHVIEEKGPFVCCICGYENKYWTQFRTHKKRHFSKITCRLCSEEYLEAEEDLHGSGYTCYMCQKIFQCKIQLEQHSEDPDEDCFNFCVLCTKEIKAHFIHKKTKSFFGCCRCTIRNSDENRFHEHLLAHKDLRPFKCYGCGRRFQKRWVLRLHSANCLSLPHKCNKCNSKFPRRDFLDAHYSIRHRQE